MYPFPAGSKARELLEDCTLLAKERLALFAAEQIGRLPPEGSPNEDFLKFRVESVAGVFDVWAGIFAESGPLTDAAAGAFGDLCRELENMLNGQAGNQSMSGISRQTYQSAIKTRLLQRKHFWIGQMLARVREHKQAMRVKSDSPPIAEQVEALPQKNSKGSEIASGGNLLTTKDPQAVEIPRPQLTTRESVGADDARAIVDSFLGACNLLPGVGRSIIETDIWKAVRHNQPRQFQYWKAGEKRVPRGTRGYTNEDDKNFCRILNMAPESFLALLIERGLIMTSR
jgi:hypothetical protein